MVNVELFKCPVAEPYIITQSFEEHLSYGREHPEIVYNGGIDLYADNHDIRAAFDGVVEKISYQKDGYGNYVRLRHVWGFSLYAHLERVICNVGNRVPAGTVIGVMGNTGFSTGIHLHFEMRDLTGKVIDPTEFFPTTPAGVPLWGQTPPQASGTVPNENINAHSPLTVLSAPAGGNLRKNPMGDLIATIPQGTVGKIISGPVYRYGLACYQVEFPVRGWMAESDSYGTKILGEIEDQGTRIEDRGTRIEDQGITGLP